MRPEAAFLLTARRPHLPRPPATVTLDGLPLNSWRVSERVGETKLAASLVRLPHSGWPPNQPAPLRVKLMMLHCAHPRQRCTIFITISRPVCPLRFVLRGVTLSLLSFNLCSLFVRTLCLPGGEEEPPLLYLDAARAKTTDHTKMPRAIRSMSDPGRLSTLPFFF